MPRRVDHIDRIIPAIAVKVLRPWVVGITRIAVLRYETTSGRIVKARVHVLQAGGVVRHAAREGDLV